MDGKMVVYCILGLMAFCLLRGAWKGAIGLCAGVVIYALSLGLAAYYAPDAGKAILSVTPFEEIISSKCESFVVKNLQEETRKKVSDALGVSVEKGCGAKGIDYESLGITREELQEAIKALELSREEEVREITGIHLPEALRKRIMENNNAVVYEKFGVKGFADYLGAFLARTFANTVAFLLIFVAANIILRLLVWTFLEKPVKRHIGGANRLIGALLGGAEGLFLIWVIFMGLSLFEGGALWKSVTEAMEMVPVLGKIQDLNPLTDAVWTIL